MGRGGPPPKPAKLRLLEGAPERRVNQNEPQPNHDPLVAPDWVNDQVREVWDYTVAELEFMGIASSTDRDALVAFCQAVVTHRKACEKLARSDILIKSMYGQPIRNPAIMVQRDAAQTIRAYAQEFGLTPSARARIEVRSEQTAEHDNPFADSGS